MEKKGWKAKIKKACLEAGTYQPYYEPVIDTLAETMGIRDKCLGQYYDPRIGKGQPVVNHTNKGGATNVVKNPLLVMVNDLDTKALAYWRDLGLTPAGLKKLNAEVVKDKQEGSFEKLLEKLL